MTTLLALFGAGSALVFLGLLMLAPVVWLVILIAVSLGTA